TRTGKSEELLKGEEEPVLIINKEDAHELGVVEGDIVEVFSQDISLRIKVKFGEVKKKHLFAPFGYGFSHQAVINTLTNDLTDPISKQPELKFTNVKLRAVK
ncbi:MAG: molybdopterin dinucleotide binding domain-containing protein, partial [Hydrogenobacter sp.]